MIKITERQSSKYGERFSVVIGDVTIKNCSFREGTSKAGKEYAFISYPQRKVTNKEGVDSWVADIVLSRPLQDRILAVYKGAESQPVAESLLNSASLSDDDIPF